MGGKYAWIRVMPTTKNRRYAVFIRPQIIDEVALIDEYTGHDIEVITEVTRETITKLQIKANELNAIENDDKLYLKFIEELVYGKKTL